MKYVSQTGIKNEEYYQLKRCDLDRAPNSHDYPTKKSMVLVRRKNVSILGMKGLFNLFSPGKSYE